MIVRIEKKDGQAAVEGGIDETRFGGKKEGETYVHEGGEVYLDVNAANCKWQIRAVKAE